MKSAREARSSAAAALSALLLAAGVVAAAQPASSPSPAAESETPPAKDDPGGGARQAAPGLARAVERNVERFMEQHQNLPHFETSIEVVGESPQATLERYLRRFDVECGPAGGGPPTVTEMRAVRYRPAPYLDLTALAGLLSRKLEGQGPERFFLYRVRTGSRVSYSLREQRIPPEWSYNQPGTEYELVETFADAHAAAKGLRRLERGMDTAVPTIDASPPPPWVTSNCRPGTNLKR